MFIIYFSFNSGDLTNTSSQICGSWYLPIFLFRDGSLTLISMASLMVLVMLWSSLSTMLNIHTYKEISTDPINKLKTKLISLLKKIKAGGGINDQLYEKMYPTGAVAPKFYGLPKIHKRDISLRSIVFSRGSINYEVAKELSRILRPLLGKSPHHIMHTGDFVQQVKGIRLQPGQCVTSYGVSALFTSVPIESAITIK